MKSYSLVADRETSFHEKLEIAICFWCKTKNKIWVNMKTELAVYEGKLCPEALGQQSIKLSH